jgi:hypothetical protein
MNEHWPQEPCAHEKESAGLGGRTLSVEVALKLDQEPRHSKSIAGACTAEEAPTSGISDGDFNGRASQEPPQPSGAANPPAQSVECANFKFK